jgi:hypothetical protein
MWACEQTGQEVPNSYWQQVDEAWRKAQRPDGGWPYKLDEKDTRATMTAAGVASLFITQDYLLSNNTSLWATCKGGIRNDNIDKGMAYLDKHVAGILKGNHYGMYGIERIGVASGHKYIGGADWYRVGAQFLVESQNEDGSFDKHVDPNNFNAIPTTVFSMVFLARGRAPVIMNKLEYELAAGPDGKKILDPWNQRPRDVANFAHWSGKQIERYLNWQVVNLKVSPDDLHDAPILYIAGSEPLAFGDTEIKKLREFVDDGGLILGNAECSSQAFTKSFVALGKKLFPRYEFRELPLNHPIYADQQFRPAKWKSRPQVDALSNGVRELMILIPDADASRAWQTRSEKTKEEIYQLVQDIFLYAVDKANLRERGQTYIVRADPKISTDHNVKVVRLIVGDNPDPEPGGWNRLAAILRNQYKVNLTVASAAPGEGKLTGAKIAHLTGTTRFKLNAAQQREIKDFVARGGTLVVDAAGGKSEFADSAEAELALMFGGVANNIGVILEPDHEVYTLSGSKIHRFDYRNFVKGKISGKLNVPRVRGIEQAGRVEVFYSREDLSAGLVGQPMDGILGYDPNTATQIMRNIILYCAGGNLKPVIAEGAANASVAK